MHPFDFEHHERLLCQRLEENCFLNGSEKDSLTIASALHSLAKHYLSCKDEMNLIRSAILFHGALARDPDNASELKEEIKRLWHHVLKCANARNRTANMNSIYNQLKEEVRNMRKTCMEQLNQLKKQIRRLKREETEAQERKVTISENQALQAKVTDDFSRIIKNLYDKCIKIMGNPPCKFAIIAMGALTRKEITPMSDFYHAILLDDRVQSQDNYTRTREYFSWLSVIFHFLVVSLGETPITSARIKNLEWFKDFQTAPGLSSCKNFLLEEIHPLEERTPNTYDFIKTSEQMLSHFKMTYATSENSSNMADLLQKTSFITGTESVYKTFSKKVRTLLKTQLKNDSSYFKNLQRKIDYDKKNLEAIENLSFLHSSKPLSYKRVLYKSVSTFIATLGAMFGIKKNSSFEIINALNRRKILNHAECSVLAYAVAVSLECHISICMKNLSGERYFVQEKFFRESITELQQAIGTQSLVEVFLVAISLQKFITANGHVAPNKTLKGKFRINYNLKPVILCALHLDNKCLDECRRLLRKASPSSSEGQMYRFLQAICNCNLNKPNQALKLFRMTLRHLPDPGKERVTCFFYMGLCHIKNNDHRLALSFLRSGYQMQMRTAIQEGSDVGLARFLFQLGFCTRRLRQLQEALGYFQQGLQIRYAYAKDFIDDLEANWFNETGHCLWELGDMETALEYFKKAVKSCKRESRDERKDRRLANLLYNFAANLQYVGRFADALRYFEEELQIRLRLSESNKDITECQQAIEICKKEIYFVTEL